MSLLKFGIEQVDKGEISTAKTTKLMFWALPLRQSDEMSALLCVHSGNLTLFNLFDGKF